MQVDGLMKVKEPTQVNFKDGSGQKKICS